MLRYIKTDMFFFFSYSQRNNKVYHFKNNKAHHSGKHYNNQTAEYLVYEKLSSTIYKSIITCRINFLTCKNTCQNHSHYTTNTMAWKYVKRVIYRCFTPQMNS